MGYSKDTLVNIGFHTHTSLPKSCLDNIYDLGIQRDIRKTHRGKRSVMFSALNNNVSPNIDLSIGVRVTQRPDCTQGPTYRPDQLFLTETNQSNVRNIKGANKSNLISLTPVKPISLENALFGLINARSLRKNSGLLRYMVQSTKCDILAITETWLSEHDPFTPADFCPDGYSLLRMDRKGQIGGGIALLCRKEYKPKNLSTHKHESFESMIISVSSAPNSLRIAVIYRPPSSSCAKFIDEFTAFLENCAIGGDSILIVGDFNIHVDKPKDTYPRKLLELCDAFGLLQHVTFPTHIRGHTVDLVLSRQGDKVQPSQTKGGDLISDHYTVLCNLSIRQVKPSRRQITYRNVKSLDIDKFKNDIKQLPLYGNFMDLNLEELTDAYHNQLSDLFNTHAPIITRTTSAGKRDPWINQEIFDAKRRMRQTERRFRKHPNRENYSEFCQTRDNFRSLLAHHKTEYLEGELGKCGRDPKLLYKQFNKIMHRQKVNPLPDRSSDKELANDFNQFFKEKIDKIRRTFNDCNESTFDFDKSFMGETLHSFSFVNEDQMKKIIMSSKPKSCSLDPVPSPIIKECVDELTPVICRIINLSLETATFPQKYKHAIVKPLLKKPSLDTELKNYRPVSNLTFISKLIEEVVSRQVNSHLVKSELLEPLQSAYKAKSSTETALVAVFNRILTELDTRESAVLLALLDMSAALDTVDHEILLKRLENTFGISGCVLQWFRSYLTNRSVAVVVGDATSDPVFLECSLPQGSKLGPRSYSDYTQPLGALLRCLLIWYHCYADDSQLFKSMSLKSKESQYESAKHLSRCITEVEKWTFNNKLKLNPCKTEFLILCSKPNRHKIAISELVLNDSTISETPTAKNLGVWIDNSLTMERHVNELCKICIFYLNWIRNIRPCLNTDMTKTLVQTLVISRIDYCNALLYKLPVYLLNKIQRVINIAARLIFRAPKDSSISMLLKR